MNSDRDTPVTDHEFEMSPYCDCQACSELCHYRYGFEDACIRERHEHITPTVPGK